MSRSDCRGVCRSDIVSSQCRLARKEFGGRYEGQNMEGKGTGEKENEPVGRKGGIYGLQAKSGRKRKAIKTEIEALGG